MNKSRYIIRQINLINVLLTGALAFFIYMLFSLVNAAFDFKLPSAKSPGDAVAEEGAKAAESALPSPDNYTIITEQNLFHPDRKIVAGAKGSAPLVRPDFVLYGTMMTDNTNIAFLEDLKEPRTTPGRGKRQRTLSLGDKLSGYTLSEVYTDRVVMVNGDDRIELAVIDPSKQREREVVSAAKESAKPAEVRKANERIRRTMPANPGADMKDYLNKMRSPVQPPVSR